MLKSKWAKPHHNHYWYMNKIKKNEHLNEQSDKALNFLLSNIAFSISFVAINKYVIIPFNAFQLIYFSHFKIRWGFIKLWITKYYLICLTCSHVFVGQKYKK